jgi:RimJ/RimL family protein N-acetyltransferase
MPTNYWQTKNLRLRSIEDPDIAYYIKTRNATDSEAEWFYDRVNFPYSEDSLRKLYETVIADQKKEDKFFFIIETHGGDYVGNIYIWHTNRIARTFRHGIQIDAKHRKKGFASEALVAVLDYYFNELNYQKCAPYVYEFNATSHSFHTKFGFVHEGSLRNEVYTRGKYYALVYYGMLKDEFNARYSYWK